MGVPKSSLYVIDTAAATPAPVLISNDVEAFEADTAGDKMYFIDTAQALFFTAVPPTGAATKADTGPVTDAVIKSDGSLLSWATAAGSFKVASTSAVGTPVATVNNIKYIAKVSPDEASALGSGSRDPSTGNMDISLITGTPPAATSLVTGQSGVLYGPGFTSDSRYAIYYDNPADGLAAMHVAPVAGGTPAMIADKVWNHNDGTGTKVVYTTNCQGCTPTAGGTAIDYFSVDVATPGATPTLIVKGAVVPNNDIAVSSDKTKVVFDYQPPKVGPKNGPYVANIQ
jgi:hypothetical protein